MSHGAYMESRGQLVGVSSLLLLCGSSGLNQIIRLGQGNKAPFLAESSHQPQRRMF